MRRVVLDIGPSSRVRRMHRTSGCTHLSVTIAGVWYLMAMVFERSIALYGEFGRWARECLGNLRAKLHLRSPFTTGLLEHQHLSSHSLCPYALFFF